MNQEALIARLKQRQIDIGLEALLAANDRGLYQCGREAGMVQGLGLALEIINEMLHEESQDPDSPDDGVSRSGELIGKSPYFSG